jgi:hypothetical protein
MTERFVQPGARMRRRKIARQQRQAQEPDGEQDGAPASLFDDDEIDPDETVCVCVCARARVLHICALACLLSGVLEHGILHFAYS